MGNSGVIVLEKVYSRKIKLTLRVELYHFSENMYLIQALITESVVLGT